LGFNKQTLNNKPFAIDNGIFKRYMNPVLDRYPVSYVMVWRNARERPDHYYAPYPGQLSADDFVVFYQHPKTLFSNDIPNLYQ